jgi:hypothetical protein
MFMILSFFAIALAASDSGPSHLSVDEVVARMIARDNERQATLNGYTAARRYVLENRRHHKRAEMVVRVTCQKDGSKQFETVSTEGWGGAQKHVFPGCWKRKPKRRGRIFASGHASFPRTTNLK